MRARNLTACSRMRLDWGRKRRLREAASLRLLAKCRPERMTGIDTDDAEFAREELQLFQRESEVLVVGMAVDIGVELRGEEVAVDHVAFELGHVDAVGGEAPQRLVKRGGEVAHPENKSGDEWPRSLFGPVRLARQYHKARGVVVLVLDVFGQDVEPIDVGRELGGNRRAGLVAALGNVSRASGGIGRNDRLDAELADDAAALAERVDVALDALDV